MLLIRGGGIVLTLTGLFMMKSIFQPGLLTEYQAFISMAILIVTIGILGYDTFIVKNPSLLDGVFEYQIKNFLCGIAFIVSFFCYFFILDELLLALSASCFCAALAGLYLWSANLKAQAMMVKFQVVRSVVLPFLVVAFLLVSWLVEVLYLEFIYLVIFLASCILALSFNFTLSCLSLRFERVKEFFLSRDGWLIFFVTVFSSTLMSYDVIVLPYINVNYESKDDYVLISRIFQTLMVAFVVINNYFAPIFKKASLEGVGRVRKVWLGSILYCFPFFVIFLLALLSYDQFFYSYYDGELNWKEYKGLSFFLFGAQAFNLLTGCVVLALVMSNQSALVLKAALISVVLCVVVVIFCLYVLLIDSLLLLSVTVFMLYTVYNLTCVFFLLRFSDEACN